MTPTEIERLITELEKDVDRLHALYNQYFMGIEKLEPTVPRKNLDRKINLLRREQIKNTALRFRLQMQIQKYNTQTTYWNRICRQIENGTYNRQVMLAKRRVKARHPYSEIPSAYRSSIPPTPESAPQDDDAFHIDLDEFGMDISEPADLSTLIGDVTASAMTSLDDPFKDLAADAPPLKRPPTPRPPARSVSMSPGERAMIHAKPGNEPTAKPAAAAARPPRPQVSPDVDPEKLKTIYRRYLAARKKCNETTNDISYAAVAASLKERILSAGGKVDFKVVIRSGKAIIKTVKPES
jgi:hypothetical protein